MTKYPYFSTFFIKSCKKTSFTGLILDIKFKQISCGHSRPHLSFHFLPVLRLIQTSCVFRIQLGQKYARLLREIAIILSKRFEPTATAIGTPMSVNVHWVIFKSSDVPRYPKSKRHAIFSWFLSFQNFRQTLLLCNCRNLLTNPRPQDGRRQCDQFGRFIGLWASF